MNYLCSLSFYEDDEVDGGDVAAAPECDWESMRSMSSSSLTPHVSTTQIRQLVTGNARTLLQVTHLNRENSPAYLEILRAFLMCALPFTCLYHCGTLRRALAVPHLGTLPGRKWHHRLLHTSPSRLAKALLQQIATHWWRYHSTPLNPAHLEKRLLHIIAATWELVL